MIQLPDYAALVELARKAPALTGKYRVTLENCGKKFKSKVGTQGNREKNRRLNQLNKLGVYIKPEVTEVNEDV